MKKRILEELNERYKDKPVSNASYEIDGQLFTVTSHFVGKKDIDKVMFNIAFKKAFKESEQD